MRHPCFSAEAGRKWGRVHLPVAPACNLLCGYCDRRTDCPNESRPGVASCLMSPEEAAEHLEKIMRDMDNISVVGLAGPGDPLASPELTLETLRLVRARHPELMSCLSSNGLALAEHWPDLYKLGVRHVTLTINAVDPAIGGRIYQSVSYGGQRLKGEEGAALLLARQEAALTMLKKYEIQVKVNTVIISGINDDHALEVARFAAAHNVALMNCLAMIPISGTALGAVKAPGHRLMAAIRDSAEKYLPQMRHCGRCRADAAGLLASTAPATAPEPAAFCA